MKGRKILLAVYAALMLVFSGCSNLFEALKTEGSSSSNSSSADNAASVTGVLISFSNVKDTSSRSAYPVIDVDGTGTGKITSFYGTIAASGGTPGTLTALTASGSGYLLSFDSTKLSPGTYTLYVYGFKNGETDFTAAKAAAAGTAALSITNGTLGYATTVTLGANSANSDTGSIALGLTCDSNIKALSAVLTDTVYPYHKVTLTWTDSKLTYDSVPGGTYSLLLLCYGDGNKTKLIYSRSEEVHVWPGCATTTWYIGSGASGTLAISSADLYTTFFVRGSSPSFYSGSSYSAWTAGNSNTGGITDPFEDLQPAVDSLIASGKSGTIYVDGTVTYSAASGRKSGTQAMVDVSGTTASQTITIKSMSGTKAVIAGGHTKRVMYHSGSTKLILSGLTISNGSADNGAGLYTAGSVELTNCTITDNTGSACGGIYVDSAATCTLGAGVSVTGNITTTGSAGAGGIYAAGTLYMADDVTVTGNCSAGSVGGICVASVANFYRGTSGSTAITGAGDNSVILNKVTGNKAGCTVNGTTVSDYTGVCDVVRLNSTAADCYARISAPDSTKNQGGIAGACTALAAGGTVYLGRTTDTADVTWNVTGTVSIANTGALSVKPVITTYKAIITGNKSAGVLACTNTGALTLTNLSITGGSAANGGGINKSGTGALNLTDCSVYGNTASASGGGIYVSSSGTVTLTNTTVGGTVSVTAGSQVTASQAASSGLHSNYSPTGGGIYITDSEVDLKESTAVAYNYASSTGGGVYVNTKGTLKIGNGSDAAPQIYANGALSAGGVSLSTTDSAAEIYGSIHHNCAADGAGLVNAGTVNMYTGSSIYDNLNTLNNGESGSVVINNGSFTMAGGTISNNGSLNGLYNQYEVYAAGTNGTFTMNGSAVVTASTNIYNSVYLAGGKPVTVGGKLTGTTPVAKLTAGGTINPGTTPAVKLGSGVTNPTIAAASGRFVLTNTAYFIGNDGNIQSNAVADATSLTTLIGKVPAGEPVTLDLSSNITVSSEIALSSGQDITLSASGAKTVTNTSYKSLFTVPSGASLTLGKNVTLDVASASVSIASAVSVSGGSFTLDGGTLSCTTTDGNSPYLLYFTKGTLNIKSGTINGGPNGIGIRLKCTSADDLVQIDGGTITNCGIGMYISGTCTNPKSYIRELQVTGNSYTHSGGGGGLTFKDGASGWTFTDCSITDNSTKITEGGASGGGICLYGDSSTAAVSNITFSGCTITGNYSQGNTTSASSFSGVVGGGIYAWYATGIQFTGCTITGNYTKNINTGGHSYGGGIFVSQNSTMTVTGTLSGNVTKVNETTETGYGSQAYVYYDSTTHIGSLTINGTAYSASSQSKYID